MEILVESLSLEWENLLRHAPRVILALVVLGVFALAGGFLSRGVDRVLARSRMPQAHRGFFVRVARWLLFGAGLVLGLNLVGLHGLAASLLAGGGFTAVALGFAFRSIGENFLAGFFLVMGRTFQVGDVIRSGEFEGTVRGIELRHTHVRASDGRDIYVPSIEIFSNPLVNYTRDGLRRLSFTLGIDYSDDVEKARQILLEATRTTPGVESEPTSGVNIREFDANFVVLEVFFWIDTLEQQTRPFNVRTAVMQRCRLQILDAGFTLSSDVSTNVVVRQA